MRDKNISEYLEAVRTCIRWKRARNLATREISDHLEDLVDAYLHDGFTHEMAVQKAIAQMGDAELVGKELDRVYRPKVDLFLAGTVAVMLAAGAALGMLSGGPWTSGRLIAVILGVILAVCLYFSDFRLWLEKPYLTYGMLSVITLLIFWYDTRNGIEWAGYGYTGYFLMLYPIALCGIVWQKGAAAKPMPKERFMLFSLWPILCAGFLRSAGAMVVLVVSISLIGRFGDQQGWIKAERRKKAWLICALILVCLIAWFFLRIGNITRLSDTGYLQNRLTAAAGDISFVGKSSASFPQSVDFPFLMIALHCGWGALAAVIGICFVLMMALRRSCKRQPAAIGQLLCMTVLVILAVQFIMTLIGDVGLMPGFSMSIPFVCGGGAYTVLDFALIGIVLSVCRNETITRDRLKQERTEKNKLLA